MEYLTKNMHINATSTLISTNMRSKALHILNILNSQYIGRQLSASRSRRVYL
jgi:hypothetical protein